MQTNIGDEVIDLRDVIEASNDPDHESHEDAQKIKAAFLHDGLVSDDDDFERYADDEPVAIHARYWIGYVQELAEDIGAVDPRADWPLCHIDWEAAASELAYDYSTFEVDGHEYYIRAV